jgi:hypothetical protein
MRKHAVVFVDVERDRSPDGGDAVQRVEEEPAAHHQNSIKYPGAKAAWIYG